MVGFYEVVLVIIGNPECCIDAAATYTVIRMYVKVVARSLLDILFDVLPKMNSSFFDIPLRPITMVELRSFFCSSRMQSAIEAQVFTIILSSTAFSLKPASVRI